MPSCEQKLYGDPRNACITTGSFPACTLVWVSYICDLLGYSLQLGNLWSKSLICTHHQWSSNTAALYQCAQEGVSTSSVCVTCYPGHFV